jgi:hypothetical protein
MTFVALAASPANAADNGTQQVPVSREIVVSQVSTQGPGGRFDEFIELQNIGTVPVNIAGYTVSACTALNMVIPLVTVESPFQLPPVPGQPLEPVILAPGETWFIANLAGYTRGIIPNQTYITDVSVPGISEIQSRGGVLVRGVAPVGAPFGAYIDAVGFTRGLTCTETAPARPQFGFLDQASLRVGLIDTNVNARDFVLYGPVLSTASRVR